MFKPRLLSVLVAMSASGVALAQEGEPTQEPNDDTEESVVEEVIVQGVKNADLNARQLERDKDAFSSVIAQDDAGNFADQNVAESLQRLPGITLQKSEGEGRYVTVRGLGPGFVTVNMNGAELASAGEDSRAFALDALPSDILGSIEVIKSLTPDMDLNSIGGTVNVKTVSAFDRKKDSMQVKAQVNSQEYRDELSPKISISGTNLLADETIGIGYSLSGEKRKSVSYEVGHHSDVLPRYVRPVNAPDTQPEMLIPYRFEARQEDAERTRTAGSLDLGYRPTDTSEYYLRLSRTEYEDLDINLREYYRFGQARYSDSQNEITYTDPVNGIYAAHHTDLQHQFFIQDGTAITTALSLGGENSFDGGWELDYNFATSKGEWEKPGGRRVQFRARDLPMIGAFGSNYHTARVVSGDVMEAFTGVSGTNGAYGIGYLPDTRRQVNMDYDNIFIEDSFRDDTVDQLTINLRKNFDDGWVNYVKAGLAGKNRERDRDKNRWSVVPADFATLGCEKSTDPELCQQWGRSTLGDFSTFTPTHPDIRHDFITYEAAEELLAITTPIATETDPALTGQDSTRDDYLLTEETRSAYVMAEFQTSENSTLIAGVKYETTDFYSDGYLTIRNDRLESGDGLSGDIALPLTGTSSSYSDVLPSIHYKWEVRDDLLFRSALWTSFTRPSFDEARAYTNFEGRIEFCDGDQSSPTYGNCSDDPNELNATTPEEVAANLYISPNNTLDVGNPTLRAMKAINFDSSLTWYAGQDLYLQAAFFYKDIKDFIVDVRGFPSTIEDLPIRLPVDQITQVTFVPGMEYDNVSTTVNGDSAKVYGLELSYSQYFPLGFFVQSNMTFLDSEASLDESIREEAFRMPDQADRTVNLTLGWENDSFSARVISNYRSKVLEELGGSDSMWADIYHDDTFGLDFKAQWNINKMFSVYFDATNLTSDVSVKYFEGDADSGKILYLSEDFGRSFQMGVNVKVF